MATNTVNYNSHVIEIGTEGIWTYRKWSDGTAECWGEKTHSMTSWNQWGNAYEGKPSLSINYPTGLFISRPVLISQVQPDPDAKLGSIGVEQYGDSSASNTGSLIVLRASVYSGISVATIGIYARGRWK